MSLVDYSVRFWKARHFWWHLTEADLRARFRRTALGMLWAILQPLLMSGVIAYVLQTAFSDTYVNYFIYIYLGMIMWELFTGSINLGSDSLIRAEGYIKQVKQPAIIYPFKSVLHGLVVFGCGLAGYAAVALAIYPHVVSWTWVCVPVFVVMMTLFCIPVAVISAVINIQFRDFRQTVMVLVQMMWFASPVLLKREIYDAENMRAITVFNPLTSLLDLLRDPLLHATVPEWHDVFVVLGWSAALWLLAIYLLVRHERKIVFYF